MLPIVALLLELVFIAGSFGALMYFGPSIEAGCAGALAIAILSALVLYELSRAKTKQRYSHGGGRALIALDRALAFLILAVSLFLFAFCAYLLIRGH